MTIYSSMIFYVSWLAASAAVSAVGVWMAREYAIRMNWLDHPNARSFHDRPTPRIGGWGLLLPVVVSLLACLVSAGAESCHDIIAITLPACVVALISFLDDRFDLPRSVRLITHFICGSVVLWIFFQLWSGAGIPVFGDNLPVWLCGLLLLVWIAGLTNAFNFMDGIDGIASIQAIVLLSGWLFVFFNNPEISTDNTAVLLVLLSALGGCIGFLVFNWPPASIFIGDTGSTFLGFFAACLPFVFTGLGMSLESALEAGALFSWPFIFDTSITFSRRLLTGKPVFNAHRSHIYQRFAGSFSHRNRGHLMTSLLFGALSLLGFGLFRMEAPMSHKLGIICLVWAAVTLWTWIRAKSAGRDNLRIPVKLDRVSDHADFDIFLSPPQITDLEYQQVQRALDSGYIAPVGPQLSAFERALSEHLDLPDIQAVSSGTAAIHLGLRALGVKPDDCVICPDMTFIASCNPIRYLGAEPVLVDISRDNWAIDIEILKSTVRALKAEGRTVRAIVVVHALGIPAPVHEIVQFARQEGIRVLEDCAGAFGSMVNEKSAGSFGDAAAFSFNGNKILTTSGGGAVFIRDTDSREKVRQWANQGKRPGIVGYDHDSIGYNYKLSNISAAIGLAQLATIESRLLRKRQLYNSYEQILCKNRAVVSMPEPEYGVGNYWLSNFGFSNGISVQNILNALRRNRIEASPLWKPMHVQSVNRDLRYFGTGRSLEIHNSFISLPSGTRLSEQEVSTICDIVLQHL